MAPNAFTSSAGACSAARLMIAANDSQSAGDARSPVALMRKVDMKGVKPPNTAVARLNASEKPEVRIRKGMISVRSGIIAPL